MSINTLDPSPPRRDNLTSFFYKKFFLQKNMPQGSVTSTTKELTVTPSLRRCSV